MPGKSRAKRERKFFKPVAVPDQSASIIPPAVNVASNQAAPVVKPASTPAASAARAAVAASNYVNRELITITLIAGTMLVIVFVVSVILR